MKIFSKICWKKWILGLDNNAAFAVVEIYICYSFSFKINYFYSFYIFYSFSSWVATLQVAAKVVSKQMGLTIFFRKNNYFLILVNLVLNELQASFLCKFSICCANSSSLTGFWIHLWNTFAYFKFMKFFSLSPPWHFLTNHIFRNEII